MKSARIKVNIGVSETSNPFVLATIKILAQAFAYVAFFSLSEWDGNSKFSSSVRSDLRRRCTLLREVALPSTTFLAAARANDTPRAV